MEKDEDITPRVLLVHIQGLGQNMYAMENRLNKHMQSLEERLTGRMDRLDNRIDRLEINLTRQIDGIDERLNEIEIEYLPKRVTVLERKILRK